MDWSYRSHLAPRTRNYIVYYSDGYIVLEKTFNESHAVKDFVDKLKKNPDFHFIEARCRSNEYKLNY